MSLRITDHGDDRTVTLTQLLAQAGGGGGGGSPARTTMTATYRTKSVSPTVRFTALTTAGGVITARTTSGISLVSGQTDLYKTVVDVTGVTDFLAVWDEGDVNDYTIEWIVADT